MFHQAWVLRTLHVVSRVPENVRSVTLEPQGTELKALNENRSKVSVPRFSCRQMVVFHTVQCDVPRPRNSVG